MSSTILTIGFFAFLLATVGWALLIRRLSKTRLRFIGTVVSLVLAIVTVLIARNSIMDDGVIQSWLIPFLQANVPGSEMAIQLFQESVTLQEVVVGCASAIATPVLLAVCFMAYRFLSWIVYLLVILLCGQKMRRQDENSSFRAGRTILLSALQALMIAVVWLIPVSTYAEMAPVVRDAVAESKILDEDTQASVDEVMEAWVTPLNENGIVKAFRAVGGDALSRVSSTFQVKGEKTELKTELSSTANLVCNIYRLTESGDLSHYGEAQAKAILSVVNAFEDSDMLPAIAGELLYSATDKWMNDQPFMGIDADVFRLDESGMFDEFMELLMEIIHEDAPKLQAIRADLRTVGNLAVVLIRENVFASLGDQEALVSALGKEGLMSALVAELGSNESMKVTIPAMTNIGLRAVAATLGIKENMDDAYADFLDNVAEGLRGVGALSATARIEAVTDLLSGQFDALGVAVDASILDCYSVSMVTDIVDRYSAKEIDGQKVRAFFAVYALSTERATEQASAAVCKTEPLADSRRADLFRGTIYEGMTQEELAKTGAAILAGVTMRLSELAQEKPEADAFRQSSSEIISSAFSVILNQKEQKEILDRLSSLTIDADLSDSIVHMTASLSSAEQVKKTSVLVTLDQLLTPKEEIRRVASRINSSTVLRESAAIEQIFGTAGELMQKLSKSEKINIAEIAGQVGAILDTMSSTESVGEKQTAGLFKAVLQSEKVRESAGIDMATASQLADKATENTKDGKTAYENTFETVAQLVKVIDTMSRSDKEPDEAEIVELIRGINPQTAGMIEVYVTPKRLMNSYSVPEKYAGTSASLLSNLFGYMAHNEMDEAQYEKEAAAINRILTVTMEARDHSNDPEHNKTLFGENGILESADSAVETLMASHAVADSLRKTLIDENGKITEDPFELSELVEKNEERDEAEELKTALHAYYEKHPDAETKLTLELIGHLFGIGDIDLILSEVH